MTDHTPLTDEELAALHRWIEGRPYEATVRSLIADLRASRAEVERIAEARYDAEFEAAELQAEVERLREQNEGLYQAILIQHAETKRLDAEVERLRADLQPIRAEADTMGEIAAEWEAEVERLRAENAELQSLAVEATKKAARLAMDWGPA